MMLHRHFEEEKSKNITTLDDVTPKSEFVSEIFTNDGETEQAEQSKRGRRKKSED